MMWFGLGYVLVVIVTLALCKAASAGREYTERYDEKENL